MPGPLGTSGPYTAEDILNAILSGTGTAYSIQTVGGTGTAALGTVTIAAGTAAIGTITVSSVATGTVTVLTGTINVATGTIRSIIVGSATVINSVTQNSDTVPTSNAGLDVTAVMYHYEPLGTVWERHRGNYEEVSLASTSTANAGRTGADQVNYNAKGAAFLIELTTGTVLGTISTLAVDAKIGTSYVAIAVFTGAITTGSAAFLLYPGATTTAGWTAVPVGDPLPRSFRIRTVTVNATATMTYQVVTSFIT